MPPMPPPGRIPLENARSNLARLWFAGSGLIFLILLLQSFATIYQDRLAEVWGWALPTLLPTLSLILSVLGANAIDHQTQAHGPKQAQAAGVRRDFYTITFRLSLIYLAVIFGTIVAEPVIVYLQSRPVSEGQVVALAQGRAAPTGAQGAADVLKMSNLWLGPFQGLVIAAMGTLFFTKRTGDGEARR
jgi:hypothetical protein